MFQWIIYWYVCGTDIETTRIALDPKTDLMSDDPNALILADPNRSPGDATRCIMEVERADLSPDVKIFMQAGGTYVWGHEKFRDNNAKLDTKTSLTKSSTSFADGGEEIENWFIVDEIYTDENTGETKRTTTPVSNGKLSRYLYDKDNRDWLPRERFPISGEKNTETDMGSQVGLVSFLKAGQKLERELYPDGNVRRVFIFVDHGQGSVNHSYFNGVICKDEYTNNMLSLKEVHDAFAEVKDGWKNSNEKPFEVVAFDACLMSTYEAAIALEDAANYMVASQEVTYGVVMLDYKTLLNTLSKNPTISGSQLGKLICDTCWNKSLVADEKFNVNTNAILTECVTDLSKKKIDALKTAYSNFGAASLNLAQKNPGEFIHNFTKFKKAASGSEKYPSLLYFIQNMIDLKDFVKNTEQNLPELKKSGDALISAINNAVIYQRRGNSLNHGGGLSTYYPFNLLNNAADIVSYQQLAEDNFTPETQSELYGVFFNTLKDTNFDLSNLRNVPVKVDANKKIAQIEIGAEDLQRIEDVRCQMVLLKAAPDENGVEKLQGISLGEDSYMKEDWKSGKFESVFRTKWLTLDDNVLFVQLVYDSTIKDKSGKKIRGSEFYVSPILLNDQPYKLFIACDYPNEKLTFIGATPNEDGKIALPSTFLEGLDKGDVVTPIYNYFAMTDAELRGEATSEQNQSEENLTATGDPITIGDNSRIAIQTIPDGRYFYVFEFVNPINGDNETTNEGVVFTVRNGKVVEAKHFDDVEKISDLED